MTEQKRDRASAQARIDEIQKLYRQWTQLVPKLEASQADWQEGITIMRKLADFYFEGEYMELHAAIEQGLDVNLQTEGEYSVMSEDALWDAFHDQHTLAWERLRAALKVLDRDGEAH